MFEFDISKWVPKFILDDKNGFAVAKAIEAAMQYLNTTISQSVDQFTEVEDMPEWRLDELAWEYNILYDYGAEIDLKRNWIADAIKNYASYGTPDAIIRYLKIAFDSAEVKEWWEYGGDPFHFNVTVIGQWSDEQNKWALKAIKGLKNSRSILDNIFFNSEDSVSQIKTGAATAGIEVVVNSETF